MKRPDLSTEAGAGPLAAHDLVLKGEEEVRVVYRSPSLRMAPPVGRPLASDLIGLGEAAVVATLGQPSSEQAAALGKVLRYERSGCVVEVHLFPDTRRDALTTLDVTGHVFRFTDYDDVIRRANDSEYGLAATIWTRDLKTALDATRRLEAGFVQVNQTLVVQAMLSYGGVKSSGLGREASLESMLEHFTHKKTVIVNMT